MGRMKEMYYEMLEAKDEIDMETLEQSAQQSQDAQDYFSYMEQLAIEREMKEVGHISPMKVLIKATSVFVITSMIASSAFAGRPKKKEMTLETAKNNYCFVHNSLAAVKDNYKHSQRSGASQEELDYFQDQIESQKMAESISFDQYKELTGKKLSAKDCK